MDVRGRIFPALLAFTFITGIALETQALSFDRDNIYTVTYFSRTIQQYDDQGVITDSMMVPSAEADELRGLAFGPDGLLYVTAVRSSGFAVLVLDEAGTIQETYTGSVYIRGNLSYGKLAVDEDYLYVAGQGLLTRFDLGDPDSGTTIYTGNQVFDVEILPTGNLLVASAYRVVEITFDGAFVREINPGGARRFVDIRGVEYDDVPDKIFVTHLGYTNFSFRLMRLDGLTGALEDNVEFWYADDLFVMSSGDLLVGSRTMTPRIYSESFDFFTEIEGADRMFVTQYVVSDSSIDVMVDIKPESDSNPINPTGRGRIPVAILGSEALDVTDIDVGMLAFGPGAAAASHDLTRSGVFEDHLQDVDDDGWVDLVLHFRIEETGVEPDAAEVCLAGETLDGTTFEGCDAIRAVAAGEGYQR